MKKLLLFMVAMIALCGAALAQGRRVDTYILADGDPADSLASGTFFTSAAVPISGAEQVDFIVRDTVYSVLSDGTTCCSPYADSLGAAIVGVSNDGVHWHEFSFGSYTRAVNDTVQIAFSGKLLGAALSYSELIGGNRSGYLLGTLSPHQNGATGTAAAFYHIPYAYARIRLAPTTRPRDNDVTGLASILGLRVVAKVYYQVTGDSYIPRGAKY